MSHIRAYTQEDYNAALQLLNLHIPGAFAPEELNDFAHYMKAEREDYFVAESNGNIVACGGINYFPENNLARLSWDFVHPDFQGKGIGSTLVNHRLELLREKSIIEVQVRTSQFAQAFYASFGFEVQEIVRDYWAEGYDLVNMRLLLVS